MVSAHNDLPMLDSAPVSRAIDMGLAVLPQPGEFADLDLLMWLQLVMVEQPVLCTPPDVITRDELHRGLTYGAKPLVILCHQLLLPFIGGAAHTVSMPTSSHGVPRGR